MAIGKLSLITRCTSRTLDADGDSMQIHVELRNGEAIITIFSKSKRNSTFDRINTHRSAVMASACGADKLTMQHHSSGSRCTYSCPFTRASETTSTRDKYGRT
jgi:hypothetical protein